MFTAPTPMRTWPPLLTLGPIWNKAPPPVMVKARSVVLPADDGDVQVEGTVVERNGVAFAAGGVAVDRGGDVGSRGRGAAEVGGKRSQGGFGNDFGPDLGVGAISRGGEGQRAETADAETPVESETRLTALAIWAAVAPSLKVKT